jgi:hypothetical protein
MGDEFAWNDRYAGDGAWTEWFEICSVAGCRPEYAGRLAEQVSSAMYSKLARAGISRADTHGEDPVAFFDSYFKLRGSRDAKKPLKSYFLHRIKDEGIDMVDFVCGTLFGSGSGRIRDIVLDWIAVLKGWKPRTVADGEGRRRVVWENAGDENLASVELAGESDALELLDEEPLRAAAGRVIDAVARRARVASDAASLLLYATSHDISLTEPCILSALGAGKSKVYSWRDKVMKALERELRSTEGGDTPLFARLLVASAAAHLPRKLREELGVDE